MLNYLRRLAVITPYSEILLRYTDPASPKVFFSPTRREIRTPSIFFLLSSRTLDQFLWRIIFTRQAALAVKFRRRTAVMPGNSQIHSFTPSFFLSFLNSFIYFLFDVVPLLTTAPPTAVNHHPSSVDLVVAADLQRQAAEKKQVRVNIFL